MNQSVHKALKLLDQFTEDTKELTLKELAEQTNMPKPTVYRLLTTLEARNYVYKIKRNDHDSRYRLGLKLLELGSLVSSHMQLREIARPFMEQLVGDINEVVHLVIVNHSQATYIEKVESTRALRLHTRIGKTLPLYIGSGPKLLLAYLEEEAQAAIFEQIHPADKRPETLKKELQQIRRQGYALSISEQDPDTTGLSFPIKNHTGEVVAALAVSGLSSYFEGEGLTDIKEKTRQTAERISAKLGYTG
ncbi:putative HTH-type transcriptional regulator YagI [Lentibacillus sp. JNUCC-1]|uniref:IclR family transcriptional regulator n=1 Tax=Lentibacillus sp. JNUCC-1 TaxID=2654513 RepID=UPI0012E7AAD7|nr:IclR family transcriptional regulator [Lentibacillus sp. JNUCC-1]MUV38658.1 putative HTH-type transcriptional regulator YagI [Lentibacillus sp. JNUCC-1]